MKAFLTACVLCVVSAMTPQQAAITRQIMTLTKVPAWSAIIDASLHNNMAFAEVDKQRIYIDAKRMMKTPRTFANVVTHECSHLNGGQHGDGSLAMGYAVTVDQEGNVLEDATLVLPGINLNPILAAPVPPSVPGVFGA